MACSHLLARKWTHCLKQAMSDTSGLFRYNTQVKYSAISPLLTTTPEILDVLLLFFIFSFLKCHMLHVVHWHNSL